MISSLFKKFNYIFLTLTLATTFVANAQEVRVIDNKGTIQQIRNNQVTVSNIAPTAPLEGDVWYDTNTTPIIVKIWDEPSGQWEEVPGLNSFWSLTGNTGTNPTNNFIGTTDAQDLVFRTGNIERIRLKSDAGQLLVNQAPVFNNHPVVIRANGVDVLAFQDSGGTPQWHWNLLGNGLNFVESNVADFRLFLEDGGNIGVNTGNPEAMVDINTIADPTADIVPLRIRPNATTPTGSASGEFHVADDGLLYVFDVTRDKWLSVDRKIFGWGRNSGNTTNEYLRQFNGAQSNNNGWRMIRDGTITAISVQSNANQTYTVEIRRNDSNTVITSLNVTGAQGNHDNTVNIDFNEGDFLQCFLNGTSIDFPQAYVEICWRQ